MAHQGDEKSKILGCDAYFDAIQARKRLPTSLQESLTSAFGQIPVSSFPEVPGGKVIEISSDTPIIDAVQILSEHNILAAPVVNSDATNIDWRGRYLGIIDYSAIIRWVLENAELAAVALPAGSATVAGVGAGTVGALGAVAAGATGSAAVVGLTAVAAGAALASGVATEKCVGKDALDAADHLGEDFYKLLLQEPFKSTTVKSVVRSYQRVPFIPVSPDSSMLTALLLLSKYGLKNVPVIELGKPYIRNFITQSAIVQGLKQCKGRDWFDCIAARTISDLGLPFVSYEKVISIEGDELILEAFKRMKDNQIGGLPVIEGPNRKIVGAISIRDIRFLLLKPQLFSSYRHLTVKDFIKTKASTSPGQDTVATSPVTCVAHASLGSVIDSFDVSKRVHRIYVVKGDECEVVGVLTLRDVISCFISEPSGYFDDYFAGAMNDTLKK